ncbi:MAG: hypothetical protein KF873_02020 [Gemmataceae bacterium]|nr:hypothetical protein [Gemmataceae bacterium]
MKVQFLRRVKIEQRAFKPGSICESSSTHEEDCLRQCVRMGHAREIADEVEPFTDGSPDAEIPPPDDAVEKHDDGSAENPKPKKPKKPKAPAGE